MLNPECLLESLSEGFCDECRLLLQQRLRLLIPTNKSQQHSPSDFTPESQDSDCSSEVSMNKRLEIRRRSPERIPNPSSERPSSYSSKRKRVFSECSDDANLILDDGIVRVSSNDNHSLSEQQKEKLRIMNVKKQKFSHFERIDGKLNNILQGLELHSGVFNRDEQKNIVDYVYHLQRMGQRGELKKRTYSEPRKWMRGKGRVTIQFGCCYNYAKDKKGTPPGIARDEEVDPLPSLFKKMIKRMVKWHILPSTCVPDSCIVNIYEKGDCIPPHIDHHDFLRPFCTVSFLTESNILFGSRLEILSPGEFSGPVSISLPKGSVLILSGNGADLAKHCVPSVSAKRISITFRKMDTRKLPHRFFPDPELQRIKPLDLSQLEEEEKKNVELEEEGEIEEKKRVELEEGEINQMDHHIHHQYYSPKPQELLSKRQEKNVQVKEIRGHHYDDDDSVHYSQLHKEKEKKNVEVNEWERKQRSHHHYYSPHRSSQRSKRQRF